MCKIITEHDRMVRTTCGCSKRFEDVTKLLPFTVVGSGFYFCEVCNFNYYLADVIWCDGLIQQDPGLENFLIFEI